MTAPAGTAPDVRRRTEHPARPGEFSCPFDPSQAMATFSISAALSTASTAFRQPPHRAAGATHWSTRGEQFDDAHGSASLQRPARHRATSRRDDDLCADRRGGAEALASGAPQVSPPRPSTARLLQGTPRALPSSKTSTSTVVPPRAWLHSLASTASSCSAPPPRDAWKRAERSAEHIWNRRPPRGPGLGLPHVRAAGPAHRQQVPRGL